MKNDKINYKNSYFSIDTLKSISEQQEKKEFNFKKTRRVKNFQIFVVTKGFGYHIIDFKKYDFISGSFFFMSEKQVYSFNFTPGAGDDGFVISFSEKYIEETINKKKKFSEMFIFNSHFKSPLVQVVAKEKDYFFTLTERIFLEYNKPNKSDEIIQALLNLLLLNSERLKTQELLKAPNLEYERIFIEFKNLVETKFQETRNAKHYAEKINISYKHLNNICKAIINKTAKQFIDEFIILEVKRCLLSSKNSVKEITEQYGFDEPTNFIKYFKKHTKLSPVQFRKKHS